MNGGWVLVESYMNEDSKNRKIWYPPPLPGDNFFICFFLIGLGGLGLGFFLFGVWVGGLIVTSLLSM